MKKFKTFYGPPVSMTILFSLILGWAASNTAPGMNTKTSRMFATWEFFEKHASYSDPIISIYR